MLIEEERNPFQELIEKMNKQNNRRTVIKKDPN
jgi:hypothetical protein